MKFKTVLLALLADEKFSIPGLAESVGISPKSVYDWVNGKFEPSKKHYAKIAEYFQITETELLGRVFTPNPEAGWLKLPILGEVPAGNPVEAIELVISLTNDSCGKPAKNIIFSPSVINGNAQ